MRINEVIDSWKSILHTRDWSSALLHSRRKGLVRTSRLGLAGLTFLNHRINPQATVRQLDTAWFLTVARKWKASAFGTLLEIM